MLQLQCNNTIHKSDMELPSDRLHIISLSHTRAGVTVEIAQTLTLWSSLELSEALWSSLELSGALWSSELSKNHMFFWKTLEMCPKDVRFFWKTLEMCPEDVVFF